MVMVFSAGRIGTIEEYSPKEHQEKSENNQTRAISD